LLNEYLSANLPKSEPEPFPNVTVEMEEPLPLETVPVGVATEAHAARKPITGAELAASERSDPDNRRGQTRYACRLGAEVYRTGIAVPTHCCLTDLSAGGCYLEVPIPFTKDTSVEITVRTYELKLRLRGTIQTSHPGYGMGVAFELKTKDERDAVQALTDYVAASIQNAQ
jgi:hypothetical protein